MERYKENNEITIIKYMNPNIRNIIFDWGGVLINLNANRFIANCNKYGIDIFSEGIAAIGKIDFMKEYELGNISTEDMRNGIRKYSKCDLSDSDIDHLWNSMLDGIPENKLMLLASLKEKYNLYLLSNTNELHWESASDRVFSYNGLGKHDFFKNIFLSHEMHLAKPDTRIFEKALEEAGLKAEETLFIDDLPANCEAAGLAGINTVHYIPGKDLSQIFK